MTDGTQNDENQEVKEIDVLKARAKQMGLAFHPSIGVEKLKLKISNMLEGAKDQVEQEEEAKELAATPVTTTAKAPETQSQKNARARKEAAKLIRVRISCMNPNKTEYEGEIFTVSNAIVGTFKKYVAYNNEEGWHVPQIIFNHLKERECQIFFTVKGPRGNKIRKGKMIKEFAIEVLPPLTSEELRALATKQAMANNLD